MLARCPEPDAVTSTMTSPTATKLGAATSADPCRGAADELRVGAAGLVERSKGLQQCARIAGVALRGHRQRLVKRAAAVCAGPAEFRHEPRRLAPGIAAEQLDDGRRPTDLGVHDGATRAPPGGTGAARRPDAPCSAAAGTARTAARSPAHPARV